jgi:hypothetical protein
LPGAEPAKPLQVVAGSPVNPSANAGDANIASIMPTPQARGGLIDRIIFVPFPFVPLSGISDPRLEDGSSASAYHRFS